MLTPDCKKSEDKRKPLGLHSAVFHNSAMETHDLTTQMIPKTPKLVRNCEVGLETGWRLNGLSIHFIRLYVKSYSTVQVFPPSVEPWLNCLTLSGP